MAKLNIFISQPMNGLSEREILAERDRIEEVLHKLFPNDELTFLSGYTSEIAHFQDENQERIYRLGCSVSIMAEADYIFLPDGYMDARGCVVEARVAGEYNIPIIREIREMSSEFSCRGDEKIRDRYDISNFGGNRV
jgi:hypothetical protein